LASLKLNLKKPTVAKRLAFLVLIFNYQPSAVSRQPSAVSRQPSAVSRQPSAVRLKFQKLASC